MSQLDTSSPLTRTGLLKVGLVLLIVAGLAFSALLPRSVQAQGSFQNITSYRVVGTANYTNPGQESFWRGIPWTSSQLAASVSPGGGHTNSVLIKSANNGYDIFMLFRWNDSQGPSYLGATEAYKAANGSLIPLNPALTSDVKQLFYNSTYYYPDRMAMLWFVGNGSDRQSSPVMVLGTNGALTGGAADIWHWQSNPTDNSKNDTGYPGGYTDPAGRAVYPPDNLSFAEDDYTNATGFYVSAGSFGQSAPNLAPYANPFVVLAGSQYSFANKTWTVEMTRSFTTDAPNYRVQLASGATYYVAFAVWQGRLGESSDFKSVSNWYTLTMSTQQPQAAPAVQTGQGVTPVLAGTVAIGTFLVGLMIGAVLLSYRRGARGAKP